MSDLNSPARPPHLLLIGASRGLGLALAEEFLTRGWEVTATIRGNPGADLRQLVERFAPWLHIEKLDMTEAPMIEALRSRLSDPLTSAVSESPDHLATPLRMRPFDMLFVNAGTTNAQPDQPIGQVSSSDFMQVMMTNALAPMRVIETLDSLVTPQGLIGVMSSGQGSVSNNNAGRRELYRGSKAALNQFMRCYDARIGQSRPLALIAPGWVRTSLGGPDARFSIGESIPGVADVLITHQAGSGLIYRDFKGRDVPW
ncbi:SDR family NAD(P)-dependent oxidoreductase [Asaia bogorensis]|uniref:Short-chain dehydrogenase n=1 Tax=Asaia bogorensis NBRC 16594 TaxID=1231624 RepID=A0AAN4R1C8_9PROT|nr:SDR family NAD(P)-dependent oxidoreductase [Asaia bogorensis]BAT18749.1 short-chain dehydrogenase/reductase SDR [Asaia bogorensis NBRC 16594]GBQ75753.1 dehydrogenase [Asaia bogorensis NBRC 16594]GEL53103.1 short-chain dehydrogenase [Asaia bogorensis NBRC 16594]